MMSLDGGPLLASNGFMARHFPRAVLCVSKPLFLQQAAKGPDLLPSPRVAGEDDRVNEQPARPGSDYGQSSHLEPLLQHEADHSSNQICSRDEPIDRGLLHAREQLADKARPFAVGSTSKEDNKREIELYGILRNEIDVCE